MRKKPDKPEDQLVNKTFGIRQGQMIKLDSAAALSKLSTNELVRQGIDLVTEPILKPKKK